MVPGEISSNLTLHFARSNLGEDVLGLMWNRGGVERYQRNAGAYMKLQRESSLWSVKRGCE